MTEISRLYLRKQTGNTVQDVFLWNENDFNHKDHKIG